MKEIINRLINLGVDLSTRNAYKKALRILGEEPENADKLYIELKNRIFRDRINNLKPDEKILFLPHCMRIAEKCKAKITSEGYDCSGCDVSECKILSIRKIAESKGYKVFVVPGGSMIFSIIKAHNPKGVIGVACLKELVLAIENIEIPGICIELDKDGCINTDVDIKKVEENL